MRFDKVASLFILTTVSDGLGGRTEIDELYCEANANIEELGLEATMKIYGDAFTDNIKASVLGDIDRRITKVKYNDKSYKVVSQRKVKNKTCFMLEVLDENQNRH